MAKRGRPRLQLDEQKIEELIAEANTVEYTADVMGCSAETLSNNYLGAIQRGRNKRNGKLQKVMYKMALQGDRSLMIWLSKQWLGYREPVTQIDQKTTGSMEVTVKVVEDDNWYGNATRLATLGLSNGNGKASSNGNGKPRSRMSL
jgi:hypothetical protein